MVNQYEIMFTNYPDVVGVGELKDMLNISLTTAYDLVRSNTIHSKKVGKQYRISKYEVIKYFFENNL